MTTEVVIVRCKLHPNYMVREDGLVYSTYSARFLKPEIINSGYHRVNIGGVRYSVHRLVAMTYIPNPKLLPCVNHLDSNKLNNNVNNLEWCTHAYNAKHAVDAGLWNAKKGEECGRSKLKEPQVIEILNLLTEGFTAKEISDTLMYTTRQTVRDIRVNKSWKHIKHPYRGLTND